jgi:hypothetical protein
MDSVIGLRQAFLPHLRSSVEERTSFEQWQLHGQIFDQRLSLSPMGGNRAIVAAFDGFIVTEAPLDEVVRLLQHFDSSKMLPMIGHLGPFRTPEFVSFADGFDFPVGVRQGFLRRKFVFEKFSPDGDLR